MFFALLQKILVVNSKQKVKNKLIVSRCPSVTGKPLRLLDKLSLPRKGQTCYGIAKKYFYVKHFDIGKQQPYESLLY